MIVMNKCNFNQKRYKQVGPSCLVTSLKMLVDTIKSGCVFNDKANHISMNGVIRPGVE